MYGMLKSTKWIVIGLKKRYLIRDSKFENVLSWVKEKIRMK